MPPNAIMHQSPQFVGRYSLYLDTWPLVLLASGIRFLGWVSRKIPFDDLLFCNCNPLKVHLSRRCKASDLPLYNFGNVPARWVIISKVVEVGGFFVGLDILSTAM